jgi:predicted ATPase
VKTFTPRLDQEHEAGINNDQGALGGEVSWMRTFVSGWRIYHLNDTSSYSPMRKTAKVHDNRFLRPDGSNLAAFLYFLHEREEASYTLIRRTVQRVVPFFDDFRLEPLRLKPDDIKLEWRHKNSDQ